MHSDYHFALQSQDMLNRPVFVLEILKKSEQILNILNIDWKLLTDFEHWLNRVWKVWTFWTVSEQILNILNIDWKFWTFWTLSEMSEQILNILKSLN
jgi:hypothetical protein